MSRAKIPKYLFSASGFSCNWFKGICFTYDFYKPSETDDIDVFKVLPVDYYKQNSFVGMEFQKKTMFWEELNVISKVWSGHLNLISVIRGKVSESWEPEYRR